MSESKPAPGASVAKLVTLMKRLLAADGCPWDREQTLDSLKPYLLEECFEVVDAMDHGSSDDHREELGDLLFQIVFQSELRSRADEFDIDDVVTEIHEKLVRRHPHVFGDASVEDPDAVVAQWDEIKAQEKAQKGTSISSALDGVPASMGALMRAQKLSRKAAKVGFDWPSPEECAHKVAEELDEVSKARQANDSEAVAEEIGDLLFAVVSLGRKLGVDAETALRRANQKFLRRFVAMEEILKQSSTTPAEADLKTMDDAWNRVKATE